jgi:3D (Asp-Asp-Asp) domain-containing protein
VLELYALDTRMHATQAELSALLTQTAQLRREKAQLAQRLSATRHTLAASRKTLGTNLSLLYKQGDVSALAVMLGASSLDDALTKLDELDGVAEESRRVIEVTSIAQSRLSQLRVALGERRAQLGATIADVRITIARLASARSERLGFIARLRTRQRLKERQIALLQRAARAAERKSGELEAAAARRSPGAAAVELAPSLAPAVRLGRTITVASTGYSLPGRTSTGMPVGHGVVAVDPSVIPLGTRLTIPGYGEGVAADTGGAVRGNRIDLWFPTPAQARAWGRRTITIALH